MKMVHPKALILLSITMACTLIMYLANYGMSLSELKGLAYGDSEKGESSGTSEMSVPDLLKENKALNVTLEELEREMGDLRQEMDKLTETKNAKAGQVHEAGKRVLDALLWEARVKEEFRKERQKIQKTLKETYDISPDNAAGPDLSRSDPKDRVNCTLVTGFTHSLEEKHPTIMSQMMDNRKEYVAKHGYNHVVVNLDKYLTEEYEKLPKAWLKVEAIKEVLATMQEGDWLFWVDADAIIMNPHLEVGAHIVSRLKDVLLYKCPIAAVGDRFEGVYYGYERDINVDDLEILMSHDSFTLNAGVMLIKCTEYTKTQLMDKWLAKRERNDKYIRAEQDALIELILNDGQAYKRLGIVPQFLFNDYFYGYDIHQCHYYEGDFIVHFAGQSVNAQFESEWASFYDRRIRLE